MSRKPKPTQPAPSTIDTTPTTVQTAPAAFAAVFPEIQALSASEIVRTNLGMERAARRGLAVAERLRPLLTALGRLPELDHHAVETMPSYALAVLYAHDLVAEAGGTGSPLSALLEEAAPLRELMLRTAELLALAGYVSAERVAAIRSGQGHVDTAGDLQALGRLYRELWARVHDKVLVTKAMVERALTLSAELHLVLGGHDGLEEDPLVEPDDPARLRAKAFTLFLRAYDECRRGVTYLRWHQGDATAIVPSLYPRRSRRPGEVEDAANDAPEVAADDVVDGARVDGPAPTSGPEAMPATDPARSAVDA